MAISIHEKMGFEIQVIDLSISPSPRVQNWKFNSRGPHYYKRITYYKNN